MKRAAARGMAAGRAPLVERVCAAARVLRTIIGAPDYERYLAHHAACHGDRVPLTREEFAQERLVARYSQPGNRCC
jgi:uncharacterized short protein YbdD (DUF466 family)